MNNFEKSYFHYNGVTYTRYTGDRRRGGQHLIYFNSRPPQTIYNPTWPQAVTDDAAFNGTQFISHMRNGFLCVDFYTDITQAQEEALDILYATHTAPMPDWE